MTAEPLRRLTPADVRDDAVRIGTLAKNLAEFLDLYEDVYADDLSEEVVNGFEFIAASAKGAANRQKALHEWSAGLADSVNADLALIKVAEPAAEDVEVPGSLWSETEALADRWTAADRCCDLHNPEGCCDPEDCGPCCRACPTCPSHTPEPKGRVYRDQHPFPLPIDPDEEPKW